MIPQFKYAPWKINALYGVFLLMLFLVAYIIPRQDTYLLFGVYGVGFTCFLLLYKNKPKNLFMLGLIARLIVLFSIPSLSDDYFRFLWDGTLIGSGLSPFLNLPAEVLTQLVNINDPALIHQLYDNMNSKPYFSVYPPINQWLFWLAASFSSLKWGVLILKIAVLLGELGVYWVLKKLLTRFSLNPNKLALYWLNPLVIIELCGNVHFDGLMVMFFLLSALSLSKLKEKEGSAYFAFAALSKLFSLMFFPLVLLKLSMKRSLKVLVMALLIITACYFPFLNTLDVQNMGSSLDLYFQRFEFNASVYYVFSYFGTKLMGYNPIAVLGPVLAGVSLMLILLVSYLYRFRNRLAMFTGFLLINTIYLLFSPIVHPWYLVMLVALSVLSEYRFAVVWSGMVFLSYWAYGNVNFNENYLLIVTEYSVVFVFLFLDIKRHFTF
ncbi:MAG: alpha-1,6-mannosyltransferase, partial [Saprospiraceae bacterium]